jgi:hypothetical protein
MVVFAASARSIGPEARPIQRALTSASLSEPDARPIHNKTIAEFGIGKMGRNSPKRGPDRHAACTDCGAREQATATRRGAHPGGLWDTVMDGGAARGRVGHLRRLRASQLAWLRLDHSPPDAGLSSRTGMQGQSRSDHLGWSHVRRVVC